MSAQRDPNKVAVMCYVPLEVVEKIRTAIKGQKIPNKVGKGKTARKPYRAMGVSNFIIKLAEEAVSGMRPSVSERKWGAEKYRKNLAARKAADDRVRSGEEREKSRRKILERTGRVIVARKVK